MPLSFFNDTVTRIRAAITVKNGMESRDWANATRVNIPNVLITAQSTSRDFAGRVENVSDRRTLRATYDADIMAGDRVIWSGDTYEVEGEVFHTKSPTGRVSSTRCTLVRYTG